MYKNYIQAYKEKIHNTLTLTTFTVCWYTCDRDLSYRIMLHTLGCVPASRSITNLCI